MMATTSLDYYDGPEILDDLEDALRRAGLDPDALGTDDLAAVDEFHARGRAATVALATLAGVRRDERVLDVGAGIGGPARFLAARYGARVTALDATPRFSAACERLTRSVGLTDRVDTVCGDALALPFTDGSFDLAWVQAVAQNIEAKDRFVAELARVLTPGGRVAMFEVVAGPGGPIHFPVPWADRPDQSWLITAPELRDLLDSGPLHVVTYNQMQAVLESIAAAGEPAAAHPSLGLHVLMPDFEARMAALARNIAEQRIEIVQAVAIKGAR